MLYTYLLDYVIMLYNTIVQPTISDYSFDNHRAIVRIHDTYVFNFKIKSHINYVTYEIWNTPFKLHEVVCGDCWCKP